MYLIVSYDDNKLIDNIVYQNRKKEPSYYLPNVFTMHILCSVTVIAAVRYLVSFL